MSNHVHLVGIPERPDSLRRSLAQTHSDYASYLNVKRRSCGHVWQARFCSRPIGAQQLWMTMAYVERNPVSLVDDALDYRWSSAHAHAAGIDRDNLVDLRQWAMPYTPERWLQVLQRWMRKRTRTGCAKLR